MQKKRTNEPHNTKVISACSLKQIQLMFVMRAHGNKKILGQTQPP